MPVLRVQTEAHACPVLQRRHTGTCACVHGSAISASYVHTRASMHSMTSMIMGMNRRPWSWWHLPRSGGRSIPSAQLKQLCHAQPPLCHSSAPAILIRAPAQTQAHPTAPVTAPERRYAQQGDRLVNLKPGCMKLLDATPKSPPPKRVSTWRVS